MNHSSTVSPGGTTQPRMRRRAFLSQAAAVGAAIIVGDTLLAPRASADPIMDPTPGDLDVLRFLAAAELVETDLWQQYAELAEGNTAFRAALKRIDPTLPDYVEGDFRDEMSHASFINSYLISVGEAPVNLDQFRTLPGSSAPGSFEIGRLTNLSNLTIDTSYYNRYRTNNNPDFDPAPPQIVTIAGKPAIPGTSAVTAADMQGIAHTAAFHFASIEQGGSSLYNALLSNVTGLDVVNILASIGPTEVYHFAAFMSALEGIFALRTRSGIVFPAINRDLTRGRITPKPCKFLDPTLPLTSVIRPRSIDQAGAAAIANGLVASGLFTGQPQAFLDAVTALAVAADAAVRNG